MFSPPVTGLCVQREGGVEKWRKGKTGGFYEVENKHGVSANFWLALSYTSNWLVQDRALRFHSMGPKVRALGAEHLQSKLVPDIYQMRGLVPTIYCSKLVFLISKVRLITVPVEMESCKDQTMLCI